MIVIGNRGTSTVTSLKITYGVPGGTQSVYNWNGNLDFLENDTVTLPFPEWSAVSAANATFQAVVSDPNGNSDQYSFNNTCRRNFNIPPKFDSRFIILLKTNNVGSENSYTITDQHGQIVYSKDQLGDNILYRDTVDLPNGCYEFRLSDLGQDGLQWWANSAAGIGSLKFVKLSGGAAFRTYNSDFGAEIRENFTTGHVLSTEEQTAIAFLEVYPNPSGGQISVITGGVTDAESFVRISSSDGRSIVNEKANLGAEPKLQFDLSMHPPGIYFINVITAQGNFMKKFMLFR